ncbi:MAG: nucleotidyl transferase AbiEii/AbiGii toxin family protein, partial [Pseudomonadota bacterium]
APTAPLNDALYDGEFTGMTREMVTKEELIEARAKLHADIRERLTGGIAAFLLSLHDTTPDFDLIGLPEAANLPAIRWKLMNLERLKRENPGKHAVQREALEGLFR